MTVALALTAGGVAAAPNAREHREAEARKACAAGRVEAGIEILAELLTEFGHPNYIYNQGRCYQQNGKPEQAISRFKEYLRAGHEVSPEERARAEGFIKELEAELQSAVPVVVTPPPARPIEPAPPLSTAAAQGAPRSSTEVAAPAANLSLPASPPARSTGRRTAAIVLGVVSAAGLVTGIAAGLQMRSLENQVETAKIGQLSVLEVNHQQEKANRYQTLQWIGYGVGAAALIGALICIFTDGGEPTSASDRRVSLTPTVGPGGQPGVMLTGWFAR